MVEVALGASNALCGAFTSATIRRMGVGSVALMPTPLLVGADTIGRIFALPVEWFFGSPLLGMPELNVPQAGAEILSNEAKLRIDAIATGVCEDFTGAIPEDPAPGTVWLRGPTGWPADGGQLGDVAIWWQGWRYVRPRDGMKLRSPDGLTVRRYILGAWIPA